MAVKLHNSEERQLVIRDDEHFQRVLDFCDYMDERGHSFDEQEQFDKAMAEYLISEGEQEPKEVPQVFNEARFSVDMQEMFDQKIRARDEAKKKDESLSNIAGFIAIIVFVCIGALIQKLTNVLSW